MTDQVGAEASSIWDMIQTRELVGRKHGPDQLAALRPVMRAVNTRLIHARIHHRDYQGMIESHLEKPIQDGIPVWELMWKSDEDFIGANNLFFVTCEGYVYACVQAMHAIADNLAHVAYYALGWNIEDLPPLRRVSMVTILERLRREAPSSPNLLPIQQAFDELAKDPHYKTLADVTNHLKHHGGLPVHVSWEPSENVPYQVLLGSFLRNEQTHPQREVTEYLEDTHLIMSKAMVKIGCTLNKWLGDNP